ncbi:uncharacterized protein EI97DRAFT_433207 [Westerdykella ornata]|uniref:Rhodopsin domain-containing protein n=1 Tax=Westerdykella ornata TaxID=318751 RepID=A0A6A6JKZ7_WESOR|nr:uncharacterized protein EI97DRAFT_433207 [Westerdykella ornata]KAF2276366.1 hypothetical protein EI97DRAFT_433207 [Westerdykella ornata]
MDRTDPKYAPAAIMARQNTMIAVTVAMTLVGAVAVGLRVFTRAYIVGTMWADDWAMIAALFFAFGYALEVLIEAKSFNAGFSGKDLSPHDMVGLIKVTIAVVVTYKLVLTLAKVSILLFYLRIAVRPSFEKLSRWTLIVVVLFQVVVTFGTIGQCVPIEKAWDLTGTVKGRCINTNIFYRFASIFHIVTDVWILLLPTKLVLSIPRPLKEKLALFGVFGLGFITVTAAGFRLQFLIIFTRSADPFFEIVPIHIWSMVEVHVGILCASAPTLRPLFSRAQRSRTKAVNGHPPDSETRGITTVTSGTIAVAIGATIRGSYRPPVPPKSPSYGGSIESSPTYAHVPSPAYRNNLSPMVVDAAPSRIVRQDKTAFELDLERNRAGDPAPRRLALLKRDENGLFRPEAAYRA